MKLAVRQDSVAAGSAPHSAPATVPTAVACGARPGSWNPRDAGALARLALLGAVLAVAVFAEGGMRRDVWRYCLAAIGVLAVATAARPRRPAAPLERGLLWPLLALFVLGVLQCLPLPQQVVHLISPRRAEIHAAVETAVPQGEFIALSVHPPATIEAVAYLAAGAAMFLMIRGSVLPHRPWAAVTPLLAIAALQGVLGVWQWTSGDAWRAVSGSYVNRNHFAGFLAIVLPFAVALAARGARRVFAARADSGGVLATLLPAVAVAVLLTGIFLSQSRGGVAATLAALLAMGVTSQSRAAGRTRRALLAALAAGLLAGALALLSSDALIRRFAGVATVEGLSSQQRLPLWRDTWELIRDYPLAGCGLGSLESALPRYKRSGLLLADRYAHNDYLQVAAEMGLAGFAAGLVFVSLLGLRALKASGAGLAPDQRGVALACLGSLVAFALHGCVDFNLYIPANGLSIAWAGGIAAGLDPAGGSSSRQPEKGGER